MARPFTTPSPPPILIAIKRRTFFAASLIYTMLLFLQVLNIKTFKTESRQIYLLTSSKNVSDA